MEHQIRPGRSSLDMRALTRSWQLVPRNWFKILPRILNTNPGEVRAGVWYLGAGTGVERGADVLLQDHARDGILCFGVQGSDRQSVRPARGSQILPSLTHTHTLAGDNTANKSIVNLTPGKRRTHRPSTATRDTVCCNDTEAGIKLQSSVFKEEVLPLLAGERFLKDSVRFELNEHDST